MNNWQSIKWMYYNTAPASGAGSTSAWPLQHKILAEWAPLCDQACWLPTPGPWDTKCPGGVKGSRALLLIRRQLCPIKQTEPHGVQSLFSTDLPCQDDRLIWDLPMAGWERYPGSGALRHHSSLHKFTTRVELPCAIIPNNDREWFGLLYYAINALHSYKMKLWIQLVQICKEYARSLQNAAWVQLKKNGKIHAMFNVFFFSFPRTVKTFYLLFKNVLIFPGKRRSKPLSPGSWCLNTFIIQSWFLFFKDEGCNFTVKTESTFRCCNISIQQYLLFY